jgi:hypothetical protein
MSTNSRIGILIPPTDPDYPEETTTIRSIYCHWDGYPSHMGKVLHQSYGTIDLVNELLDKGDARLIDVTGNSEHYMHSEGGCSSDTMTVNRFTEHFLEEYNYIAIPVPNEDGFYTNVEWVVCEPPIKPRYGVEFKLVIDELIKPTEYPLSSTEKQILYMDQQRIYRINPAVLGTMYKACNKSLENHYESLQNV